MGSGGFERALRGGVRGEVDFSTRRRAEYSSDASNYRRVPLGVVFPRDAGDVVAALAACREHAVPVTARGAGTSVAGNAVGRGVVLDFSRHMNRVVSVDPDRRRAVVEPGVVLDDLNRAAAAYGLAFGPDPSTHSRCTIGGMIGNDACGSRSLAYGRTSDNVDELDVACWDGTRFAARPHAPGELDRAAAAPGRVGRIHAGVRDLVARYEPVIRARLGTFGRQASGYPLHRLLPEQGHHLARALVGTEGTCALVLGATVRLVPVPAGRHLVVAGFTDMLAAADAVPAVLEHAPTACEGIDRLLVEALRARRPWAVPPLPAGAAWLLIEFPGGPGPVARTVADRLPRLPGATEAMVVGGAERQRALWRLREDGAGLATRLPDGAEAWPGFEDAAVPPERLGAYLRDFFALLERHGRRGVVYGHFGEGCLHVRIDFDLATAAGVARFREFVREASLAVAGHGGSLSGEHGDGRARSEFLPVMYGTELVEAFAEFKAVFDPDGGLNPGIVVAPAGVDADLRGAAPPPGGPPAVAYAYPQDRGDFSRAVRRCVGVGRCRADRGGVMCPSFRATHDEKDSTRGRARVLQEMVRGELVRDGWRSAEVAEALELCLACKACRAECPVGVDVAAYRSEVLHQRYRHRPRPVAHYTLGRLPTWARLASLAPRAVNRVMGSPLAPALKRMAGVAPERRLPEFAPVSFLRWFRGRAQGGPGGDVARGRVLVWPDTFTNRFTPRVGVAAVEVLEAAGFEVCVPPGAPCCGLTLVSTGQLGAARRVMRAALAALDPFLEAGVPVVGLEPSCAAVFRSDLPELLPGDPRAHRAAAAVRTLAELLEEAVPDWTPDWTPDPGPAPGPASGPPVILQPHCHQRAVLGVDADVGLLRRLGHAVEVLDAGCCGMAGDFGFTHAAVSRRIAETGVLARLAELAGRAPVVADGFSCRLQLAELGGRTVSHLAELIADPRRDDRLDQGRTP